MGPVKVVFVNIALNSGGHQASHGLLCGCQPADVRGPVGHEGHLQSPDARLQRVRNGWKRLKTGRPFIPGTHGNITPCGADYSDAPDFRDLVPRWQGLALVVSDQQVQLCQRKLALQFMQGVYRVAGTRAKDFPLVHHHLWQMPKGQPCHGQSVLGIGQRVGLVPGITGGHHTDLVKLQLVNGGLNQRHVGQVGRIKCPAKDTQSGEWGKAQTQFLGTRKWLSRRASGEPASSLRWYDQRTSGGMDSNIDSVRPPDCKPK
jgi:hypothetical protein